MKKISSDAFFPVAAASILGFSAIGIDVIITKQDSATGICIFLSAAIFLYILGLLKLKSVFYERGKISITPLISNTILTEIEKDEIMYVKNVWKIFFGPLIWKMRYSIDAQEKNIYFMKSLVLFGKDFNDITRNE
jgi:hypothetical protein